jgi:hypothetical protein
MGGMNSGKNMNLAIALNEQGSIYESTQQEGGDNNQL